MPVARRPQVLVRHLTTTVSIQVPARQTGNPPDENQAPAASPAPQEDARAKFVVWKNIICL